MWPSICSRKQPTQLHPQAELGRQTLHHYQSLKISPDSDYTLPIARPYLSRVILVDKLIINNSDTTTHYNSCTGSTSSSNVWHNEVIVQ